MQLQINVFALFIAAIFYVFAAIVWLIVWRSRRDRKRRWAILAPLAVLFLILPWADEVYIAYRFARLCEDAGVHVYRKVEAEGFYDDTAAGPASPGPITNPQAIESREKSGFRFLERKAGYRTKKYSHVEKMNGQWVVSILDQPTAKYVYKFTDPRQEIPVGYQLEKYETIVVDSQTGEVLGRDTSFKRFPGWINFWAGFFGSGLTICNGPLDEPEKQKRYGLLYKYVLIPTNR